MNTTSNKQEHCPIWWCNSFHDGADDAMHYGHGADFVAAMDAYNSGMSVQELVNVSLDQLKPDGELVVAMCSTQGSLVLTLAEAKRLAVHLVQLDIDATP